MRFLRSCRSLALLSGPCALPSTALTIPAYVEGCGDPGDGTACGNENACIGMGSPIGGEALDLRNGWGSGSSFGPRRLQVRYRRI